MTETLTKQQTTESWRVSITREFKTVEEASQYMVSNAQEDPAVEMSMYKVNAWNTPPQTEDVPPAF